jgi:hypothetical protein
MIPTVVVPSTISSQQTILPTPVIPEVWVTPSQIVENNVSPTA